MQFANSINLVGTYMKAYDAKDEAAEQSALEARIKRLELILEAGLYLSSEWDMDRLLNVLWEHLTEVMSAERASIFLIDEETGELWSKIAQGTEEIRFPIGRGLAGMAAETGDIINTPDAYADPRFNPEFDRRNNFRTRSILTVPMRNRQGEIIGVAQVLNKKGGEPFDREDEELLEALSGLAAVAIETVNLYEDQRRAFDAVITGLNAALEARDPASAGHAFIVQRLSDALAEEMGLPEEECKLARYAAALHDLGKIAVPDEVLMKNAPLKGDEILEYQLHALRTKILLERMGFQGDMESLPHVAPFNHKRLDGGGYPEGYPEREKIPLGARIVAVADMLHVLRIGRYGRAGISTHEAIAQIEAESGRAFDPQVVDALVALRPRLEEIRRDAERSYEAIRVDFR